MRLALVILLAAGCTANDDMPPPRLSSVVPTHAAPGTSVMLLGSNLCQQPGSDGEDPLECQNMGQVEFASSPGSVENYTDTAVTAIVPDLPAGSIDVAVVVLGRRSNGIQLQIETVALR